MMMLLRSPQTARVTHGAKRAVFGAILAFCLMSGEMFSSSAVWTHRDAPEFSHPSAVRRQPVPSFVSGWVLPALVPQPDAAAESASLVLLGAALIVASGFWRHVVRRRQTHSRRPRLAVQARASAPMLRVVPPQQRAS